MQDYMKSLSIFTPVDNGEFIKLSIPIICESTFCMVTLEIYYDKNGYTIAHDAEDFFYHCSYNNPEYYYKRYIEESNKCHFNIQYMENRFYKEYPYNFSITVAVNEFARFFVYLDDFIESIE